MRSLCTALHSRISLIYTYEKYNKLKPRVVGYKNKCVREYTTNTLKSIKILIPFKVEQ